MKNTHNFSPPISLEDAVKPTTVIKSDRLNQELGTELTIVSETFQHTGSFKFRAAFNLARNVSEPIVLTASSGNFGQALAYACKLLGKKCIVVMPLTSAKVKVDGVKAYGGIVELVDVTVKTRSERLQELSIDYPDAYVASAYDNAFVIEGNASLGREICALGTTFDYIVVPVGGGGLSSGIVRAVGSVCEHTAVVGAEPLLANDAARSLRQGTIVANTAEPPTLADGARTLSLGKLNWEILREGLESIVEVPEEKIKEAVRLLYSLSNLKVEPTGALALGAILSEPTKFHGKSVCSVVSGGNVDATIYARLLQE